tara:strand:+ start:951 stop:1361 length:411 start_codon:yes stop_codon:yes gene_type:complete
MNEQNNITFKNPVEPSTIETNSVIDPNTIYDKVLGDLHMLVNCTKDSVALLKEIKSLSVFNKKVLNLEDLVLYTGLSESTIYKLSRQDLIPKGQNTEMRKLFFEKDRIDAWLLGQPDISDAYFEEKFNEQLLRNKR